MRKLRSAVVVVTLTRRNAKEVTNLRCWIPSNWPRSRLSLSSDLVGEFATLLQPPVTSRMLAMHFGPGCELSPPSCMSGWPQSPRFRLFVNAVFQRSAKEESAGGGNRFCQTRAFFVILQRLMDRGYLGLRLRPNGMDALPLEACRDEPGEVWGR